MWMISGCSGIILLSWILTTHVDSSILTDMERPVIPKTVFADQGSMAFLPCDVKASGSKDDIFLILWFKDNASKPLYSIDVMGMPLESAKQWSDLKNMRPRLTFDTGQPNTGLKIDTVTIQDAGNYRCRVDYRNSPTKNFKINLSIQVPPEEPEILDSQGRQVGLKIGPYKIGDNIFLKCRVKGGVPSPKVIWWKDGNMLDDTHSKQGDVTSNELAFNDIQRKDLGAKFICQAGNSKEHPPKSKEVELMIRLPPTQVEILKKPVYVSEGRLATITCQAVGGYPAPQLEWWLNTTQLDKSRQVPTYQGVSKAVLQYVPRIEDDGQYITCRVFHDDTVLEDSWEIKVLYKPQVVLRLGKSLDPDNLFAGNDVYLECLVKSNPIPTKLTWIHNGREISSDPENGVIMSTRSLVLQKVHKKLAGNYACQASNSVGSSSSNIFPLKLLYAPECKEEDKESPHILFSEIDQPVTIDCQVEAFPGNVRFGWYFNNSELEEWISPGSYQEANLTSSLKFIPKSMRDYGDLFCTGENSVGAMQTPCAYRILPTGKPSALTQCVTKNKTISSMTIECVEGYDGGLPVNFLLQVHDPETMKKLQEHSKNVPIFELSQFEEGANLKIYIYAENAKGMSDPVILEETIPASTAQLIEMSNSKAVKISSKPSEEKESIPWNLIIVAGSVGLLSCVIILITLAVWRRKVLSNMSQQRGSKVALEFESEYLQPTFDSEYSSLSRAGRSDQMEDRYKMCSGASCSPNTSQVSVISRYKSSTLERRRGGTPVGHCSTSSGNPIGHCSTLPGTSGSHRNIVSGLPGSPTPSGFLLGGEYCAELNPDIITYSNSMRRARTRQEQPGARVIQEPGLRNVQEPGLRNIQEPGLRTMHEQPGLRTMHEQPGIRTLQEPDYYHPSSTLNRSPRSITFAADVVPDSESEV